MKCAALPLGPFVQQQQQKPLASPVFFCLIWSQEWLSKRERQQGVRREVWSIVFGGRVAGLRAALEPLELFVICPVTSLSSDNEDEQTTRVVCE